MKKKHLIGSTLVILAITICFIPQKSLGKIVKSNEKNIYSLPNRNIRFVKAQKNNNIIELTKYQKVSKEEIEKIIKDYKKLSELKIDNYEELSVNEFRNKINSFISKKSQKEQQKILDLYETIYGNDILNDLKYKNEEISYIVNVLLPLLSDNWTNKDISGRFLLEYNNVPFCEAEYNVYYKIQDKEKVLVKDLKEVEEAIPVLIKECISENYKNNYTDKKMSKLLTQNLIKQLHTYENDYLDLEIDYCGYMSYDKEIKYEKKAIIEAEEKTIEQDYREVLSKLMIDNYEEKSVVEFQNFILNSFEKDSSLYKSYNKVRQIDSFSEIYNNNEIFNSLNQEEQWFLLYTLPATINEYNAKIKNNYSEKTNAYSPYLIVFDILDNYNVSIQYIIDYEILEEDRLTVKQRDAIFKSFKKEIENYIKDMSKSELKKGNFQELEQEAQRISKTVSTELIKFSVHKNSYWWEYKN